MHPLGRRRRRQRAAVLASERTYQPLPGGATPLGGPLEVVEAYRRAWNAHDHKALAALFAPDADYVNVVGLWWTSQRSIERTHKRAFRNEFAASSIAFDKVAFRQVGADGAVLTLRWIIRGQVDPGQQPTGERRGILMLTLESNDVGNWLIVAAQATDIVAAADTNVARDGGVTATSYLPQVPDLPAEEP